MTNPKIRLAVLFLVVLTAIVSLQQGHKGNDVHGSKAVVEQSQKYKSLTFLHDHKAEYLEDAVPMRLSSLSVSSKDNADGMRILEFFNHFFRNIAGKNYLSGVPLLCRTYQHRVNIHGP